MLACAASELKGTFGDGKSAVSAGSCDRGLSWNYASETNILGRRLWYGGNGWMISDGTSEALLTSYQPKFPLLRHLL